MFFYRVVNRFVRVLATTIYPVEVKGLENVPKNGAFLLCPNHVSNLDPPFAVVYLNRKVYFMAKSEMFKFRPWGAFISYFGAFPVKRGGRDVGALKHAFRLLRNEEIVCVFPEGTRSKDGSLLKGKIGAASLSFKAQVPIVPVGIVGSFRLFKKTTISYGEPLTLWPQYSEKPTNEDYRAATDQVMEAIASLIEKEKE